MTALQDRISVLVVEDYQGDFFLIEEYLIDKFIRPDVFHAKSFAGAKEILTSGDQPDAILLDLTLPDASGENLVKEIVNLAGHTPVIVLTGYGNREFGVKTLAMGISDYLLKDELNEELLKRSISYSIERKKVMKYLEESEKQYKDLFDLNPEPMWVFDHQTLKFLDVNKAAVEHYGYSEQEFLNMSILDISPDMEADRLENFLSQKWTSPDRNMGIWKHRKKNGDLIDVEISANDSLFEGKPSRIVLARDVTEKIKQEEIIQNSLKEKETLLAEIHHRVKNNLAVISAMLQLQADHVDNRDLSNRLFESMGRIKTIANIHEHLYLSDNFSNIDFTENIRELVGMIIETFEHDTVIDVNYECDKSQLNVNQAIPCSLIINEVITNSVKHAFNGREKGKISIRLKNKEDRIHLIIDDDGIGIPLSLDEDESLGLQIVSVLSRQLKADYEYKKRKNTKGTRFTLNFSKAEIKGSSSSHLI